MKKTIFISALAITMALNLGIMATPVMADGTDTTDCEEYVTVTKTVTETGAYGQETERQVEEKRCKIYAADLPDTGLDSTTQAAIAATVVAGLSAILVKKFAI